MNDKKVVKIVELISDLGIQLEQHDRDLAKFLNGKLGELVNLRDNRLDLGDSKDDKLDDYIFLLKDTINSLNSHGAMNTVYYCYEYFDLLMSESIDGDELYMDMSAIDFAIALDRRNYNVDSNLYESIVKEYTTLNTRNDDKIEFILEDRLIILDTIERSFKELFAHYNL